MINGVIKKKRFVSFIFLVFLVVSMPFSSSIYLNLSLNDSSVKYIDEEKVIINETGDFNLFLNQGSESIEVFGEEDVNLKIDVNKTSSLIFELSNLSKNVFVHNENISLHGVKGEPMRDLSNIIPVNKSKIKENVGLSLFYHSSTEYSTCKRNGDSCSGGGGSCTIECCSGNCAVGGVCSDEGCHSLYPNNCGDTCYPCLSGGDGYCSLLGLPACCSASSPYFCSESRECWYTRYYPNPCADAETDISGYVKTINGQGVSNVRVMLFNPRDGSFVNSAYSNINGFYYINNIKSGIYSLVLDYSGKRFVMPYTYFFEGEKITRDFTIPPTTLSGYVKSASGEKLRNVKMTLRKCDGTFVDSDFTDSEGYFEVSSDDIGSFSLYANYNSGYFKVLDCRELVGSSSFNEDLVFAYNLHGYLKDLDNTPLNGNLVEIYDCSDNFIKSTRTNSNGYYSIIGDIGFYKIVIRSNDGKKNIILNEQYGSDCNFLIGNIELSGYVNGEGCSAYDYVCSGRDKLFNCRYEGYEGFCSCNFEHCYEGCTNGLPECDFVDYGNIFVDVDDSHGNPIRDARVYLRDTYKGLTSSSGKYTLSAPYGYRDVKVNCPDGSYCGEEQIYVNGNEYAYFDCDCSSLDSDGDGLTDEEERIIGLDPNNPVGWIEVISSPDEGLNVCGLSLVIPSFSGFLSESEVNSLVNDLNSSSSKFSMLMNDDVEKSDILSTFNLDESKLVMDNRTIFEMFESNSSVRHISDGASVILVVTDSETGVTSVFSFSAGCVGLIVGILAGACDGLKDDIVGAWDLGKLVYQGIVYIFDSKNDLESISSDIEDIVKSLGGLLRGFDEIIKGVVMGIFGKGKWILDKLEIETGTEEYLNFQISFFFGYLGGYIAEQILLFKGIFAGVGKGSKTLKVIAKGTNSGGNVFRSTEILSKISNKFGTEIMGRIQKLAIWKKIVDKWSDNALEEGLPVLVKNKGELWISKKSPAYLETLSEDIGNLRKTLSSRHKKALDDMISHSEVGDASLDLLHRLKSSDAKIGLVKAFDNLGSRNFKVILSNCKNVPDGILKDVFAVVKRNSGSANILKEIQNIKFSSTNSKGMVFGLKKGNLFADVHYIDDGKSFVKGLGGSLDKNNANKGFIGEEATDYIKDKKGWKDVFGFNKDSTNQIGIDRIYKDGDDFVFVESKFVSEPGNVGKGILGKSGGNTQMDDGWIGKALEEMKKRRTSEGKPLITDELYDELKKAVDNKKIRKELVVVQNTPFNGNTIVDSIGKVGIEKVHLIKIGEVI